MDAADKRLVILGCGYVGSAVALSARAQGLQVTALTRNADHAEALRPHGIETILADLATSDWHGAIRDKPDYVLNCVSSGGGTPDHYRHSYVDGMASILAWARTAGPVETMVYTSSTSVYPQGGGVTVDETFPAAGEGASERAQLLRTAETRLESTDAETTRRWFILRLAGIYGPGRHHFVEQVRAGEAPGRGDHHLNLIHRDDIVSAVLACFAAAPHIRSDIFNLVDDGPAPKREVTAWLAERLGVSPPRFTGELASARRPLTPDRRISNAKIKRALGWSPRHSTFREGCAKFLSR